MRPITGVERYAHALLPIVAARWPDARIALPTGAIQFDTRGLTILQRGGGAGHWWEQAVLPTLLRAEDVLLNPANTGPLQVRRQATVVHDLAFLHNARWHDRRMALWYRTLLPRLVRRSAVVITPSATVRHEVLSAFGPSPEKVKVVPPPVHRMLSTSPPIPRRPYLLLVGAFDPRKQAAVLAHSYQQMDDPPFDLVMIGRRTRSFRPVHLPADPRIHVLEAVDDQQLAELYAGAHALVHASTAEGFGLPVLEAMAAGCPVIARDLPVLRETAGNVPSYTDIDDPRALEQAISALSNPDERAERIRQGLLTAATFDPARTTEALVAALAPLLPS